jgi:hypothetical protein
VILIGRGKPHHAVGTVNVAEIFVAGAVISSLLSETGLQTIYWDLAIALDLGGSPRSPCLPEASFQSPAAWGRTGFDQSQLEGGYFPYRMTHSTPRSTMPAKLSGT